MDIDFIKSLAEQIDVPLEGLQAVIDVESAGSGFMDDLVTIRWEGHYFWRFLPDEKKSIAQSQGLAHPKAGAVPNPRAMSRRHTILDRAIQIDRQAALKSISMGMGQVMGANFALCGYRSVEDMWEDCRTPEGQLRAMVGFIDSQGLDRYIRDRNWAAFARKYNGPNYKINQYDVKLQRAFEKHGGLKRPNVEGEGSICLGHPDPIKVKALQTRLSELGYRTAIDGDFGPMTERAVKMFQIDHGLEVTGCSDAKTRGALEIAEPKLEIVEKREITESELKKKSRIASGGDTVTKVGGAVAVTSAASKVIEETNVVENIETIGEVVKASKEALEPAQGVVDFFSGNLWLVPLIVGVFLVLTGRKIINARLEDHKTGKTL